MEDKKHAFSEADIYQAMVDKMMPEKRHEREAEARALAMAQRPDFLTPDWSGLMLHSVMTVREAVALSCGINRRCAWVIEHHVGEGAARAAIDSARKRLRYVLAECGVTPVTDIALKRMVDWTGSTGWSLPIGFPGVKAVLTESSGPPVVGVTARVEPLGASDGEAVAESASAWTLIRPRRIQGYAWPLYEFLKAAYAAGKPCPTARDALEAWRIKLPQEVLMVLPGSMDYYNAKGGTKTANLEAIGKAIGRMTEKLNR